MEPMEFGEGMNGANVPAGGPDLRSAASSKTLSLDRARAVGRFTRRASPSPGNVSTKWCMIYNSACSQLFR